MWKCVLSSAVCMVWLPWSKLAGTTSADVLAGGSRLLPPDKHYFHQI